MNKKKKSFVPVTITLETEEEVKLLQELTAFVDTESMKKLQEMNYEIEGDVTIGEIDEFSEDLYEELASLI